MVSPSGIVNSSAVLNLFRFALHSNKHGAEDLAGGVHVCPDNSFL
jgi:hypothetical protein